MGVNPNAHSPQSDNAVFQRLLTDALAIQDRFVAEPMLKTTGKGHLKSRGVEGLQQDAAALAAKYPKHRGEAELAR